MGRRCGSGAWAIAALVVLLPSLANAQNDSGIAGAVRDSSGGVLPGVIVEATSPALIEKVRTAVTDGQGRSGSWTRRTSTYNLFNAGAVIAHNNNFGAAWQRPTQVLQGRLLKCGGQVDF